MEPIRYRGMVVFTRQSAKLHRIVGVQQCDAIIIGTGAGGDPIPFAAHCSIRPVMSAPSSIATTRNIGSCFHL